MAKDTAPPGEETGEAAPRKKGGPMLPIILTALIVGPASLFGSKLIGGKPAAHAAEATDAETDEEHHAKKLSVLEAVTFPLDSQTVNLADGDRYARCSPVLGFKMGPEDAEAFREWVIAYTGEEGKSPDDAGGGGGGHGGGHGKKKSNESEAVAALKRRVYVSIPLLQDGLIRELSGRHYDELLDEAAKDALSDSLKTRFQEVLGDEAEIDTVYFTEFIMQ